MPARVWTALAGLITVLLVAVVGLDQWQTRRGEVSLFGLPWRASPAPAASAPVMPKSRELPPPVPSPGLAGASRRLRRPPRDTPPADRRRAPGPAPLGMDGP